MQRSPLAATAMILVTAWFGFAGSLSAQDQPRRFTIWDLGLGEPAAAIPDEYINHACGNNGGPPAIRIKGFTDFRRCAADANGLHEVYFEYDDELEYRARALGRRQEINMYAGTTVFEFPIVASALFDEDGRVRGIRMVTDPRQHVSRDPSEFWELANFLLQRFGEADWTCQSLAPAAGEQPVGTQFIKKRCEKTVDGRRLLVAQSFYEKDDQPLIDPRTGAAQPPPVESMTRFEMYDATTLPPRAANN